MSVNVKVKTEISPNDDEKHKLTLFFNIKKVAELNFIFKKNGPHHLHIEEGGEKLFEDLIDLFEEHCANIEVSSLEYSLKSKIILCIACTVLIAYGENKPLKGIISADITMDDIVSNLEEEGISRSLDLEIKRCKFEKKLYEFFTE